MRRTISRSPQTVDATAVGQQAVGRVAGNKWFKRDVKMFASRNSCRKKTSIPRRRRSFPPLLTQPAAITFFSAMYTSDCCLTIRDNFFELHLNCSACVDNVFEISDTSAGRAGGWDEKTKVQKRLGRVKTASLRPHEALQVTPICVCSICKPLSCVGPRVRPQRYNDQHSRTNEKTLRTHGRASPLG